MQESRRRKNIGKNRLIKLEFSEKNQAKGKFHDYILQPSRV